MKNIKLFIIILSAFVIAMPIISLAQTTNVSGKAVPIAPTAIQATPAETKSVSASNTTTKCGVNTFSVSNECGAGVFKNSYVQCYDGYIENQGGESSCKSSLTWQEYAKSICANRCATVNTTTKSSVPSAGSSGGQNVPITSTKTVSPGIPTTTVVPQVMSVCYIGDDLMKQYDVLISEFNTAQANGDTERANLTTQKIIELKNQIALSKNRCNTAATQSQPLTAVQAPTISSSGTLAPVEVNRCDEVKQWQEKFDYYQNL